jgi:hypothetical protein
MEVDETFAGYILGLQDIAKLERGVEDRDTKYRRIIYEAFPELAHKAEKEEFTWWLWSVKIEECKDVIEMRERSSLGFESMSGFVHEVDKLKLKHSEEFMRNEKAAWREFRIWKAVNKLRLSDETG